MPNVTAVPSGRDTDVAIIFGYVQTDKMLNTFTFEGFVLDNEIGTKMSKMWSPPKGSF